VLVWSWMLPSSMKQSINPLFSKCIWMGNTVECLIMHWHKVHGHAIDRPHAEAVNFCKQIRKLSCQSTKCRGKRIQLRSLSDAIN
jgi:hypothetical protein